MLDFKMKYSDCLINNHFYNDTYPIVEGWGQTIEVLDTSILNGLCDYFMTRMAKEHVKNGSAKSLTWNSLINSHESFVNDILNRNIDSLHNTLKNLCNSPLTRGIFGGDILYDFYKTNEAERKLFVFGVFDKLVSIAEATGLIVHFNPEDILFPNIMNKKPEFFLDILAKNYQFDIRAPKYAGGNLGIQTDYGLYSQRDMFALYLALTVSEKYKDKNVNICEIGGGAGHLAYYLNRLGYRNLTIVDLPTISTVQKYFLDMNLYPNNGINLMSPEDFTGEYDLVINADSFIEMNINDATRYLNLINKNGKHLISLNQETGPHQFGEHGFRVCDIANMRRISRHISWIRRGWVYEEYISDNIT